MHCAIYIESVVMQILLATKSDIAKLNILKGSTTFGYAVAYKSHKGEHYDHLLCNKWVHY